MKSSFREYYPPSDRELEQLWTDGLLILDTNALLNLFRYSKQAREDFIKALTVRRRDLWLPHQVGLEFHRNRLDVVNKQQGELERIISSIDDAKGKMANILSAVKQHPTLDVNELRAKVEESTDGLLSFASTSLQQHKESHEVEARGILDSVDDLFEGRVGEPYGVEDLASIHKEGKERYQQKVPPGYCDKDKKDEPGCYGDLVLWKQILAYATEMKKPALFVTNDRKEDWWRESCGKTVGPRPELVAEYFSASGCRIHFYTSDRFLNYAIERGLEASEESVTEVKEISIAQYSATDHERLAEGRHLQADAAAIRELIYLVEAELVSLQDQQDVLDEDPKREAIIQHLRRRRDILGLQLFQLQEAAEELGPWADIRRRKEGTTRGEARALTPAADYIAEERRRLDRRTRAEIYERTRAYRAARGRAMPRPSQEPD